MGNLYIIFVGVFLCILILAFLFFKEYRKRKKIEEALVYEIKKEEKTFDDIIDKNPLSIQITDKEGYTLKINPAHTAMFGSVPPPNYSILQDLQLKGLGDFVDKIKKGEVVNFPDMPYNAHDLLPSFPDVPVWLRAIVFPINDASGKPEKFVFMHENITERKKAEEKLKKTEEKYRRLFESARDSILILDSDSGEITDSNPFIEELLEYSPEELTGKKIFEISPFKEIVKDKEKFFEIQKKDYVSYDNLLLQTKSGLMKNVDFVSTIYLVGDKKVIQCNLRDITERVRKEKELDQAKSDFITLTSHQLRTPLTSIKWVLESLMKNKSVTPIQKEKFSYLKVLNERLINLVNNVLSVTSIESGKLIINKKFTDLMEIINNSVSSIKILAESKKKNIKIVAPQELVNVYCDPFLINQALENLLSNAVNYSPENFKDITITISEKEGDYLVAVHNDGTIDSSIDTKIKKFDKFIRGVGAFGMQPIGIGLGLYITKKIVEADGGTIWFESNTKSGTTFYLTIKKVN